MPSSPKPVTTVIRSRRTSIIVAATWDVNKVYGILRPPTEQGAVNQPGDADLFKPYATLPGMIQGAHRFSELAKRCPQIYGVVIDDFYNDYPSKLSPENLRNIKYALLGRLVDEKGNVDHSSPAATPHLKLYAVLYNHQLDRVDETVLDLIDGVSFWVGNRTKIIGNSIATLRP